MARIVIDWQNYDALDQLEEELQAIADVQNLDDDYETLLFLINFYKAFNALLLRGDCTREVKEFIKDEAGWVETVHYGLTGEEKWLALGEIAKEQELDSEQEAIDWLIQQYKLKKLLATKAPWESTKLSDKLESLSPNRIQKITDRAHVLTVAQQLRILADTLEA